MSHMAPHTSNDLNEEHISGGGGGGGDRHTHYKLIITQGKGSWLSVLQQLSGLYT